MQEYPPTGNITQEEYLQVFNLLPFPCLLIEPLGSHFQILDVNSGYCKLTKLAKNELLGLGIKEAVKKNGELPEELPELIYSSFKKVFSSGKPDQFQISTSQKNPATEEREEKTWQLENIPLLNSQGHPKLILNIFRNITAEKFRGKKATELDLKLKRHDHFIHKNPDGLYSLDLNGCFQTVNDGLVKLAETTEKSLLKMHFLQFCTTHHRDLVLNYFKEACLGKNQKFEADFITAKGNPATLDISLVPMRIEGEIIGIYGIAKDISQKRIDEKTIQLQKEELTRKDKMFQILVQKGSNLLGILDENGRYIFTSQHSAKSRGSSPGDFLGKSAFLSIHPDDVPYIKQKFEELKFQKQTTLRPFRLRNSENNWRWIKTTATNLLEDPAIQGIVINSTDVTTSVENALHIKKLYERYRLAASAAENLIYDWDLRSGKVTRYFEGKEKLFGYTEEQLDAKNFWKENIHPEEQEKIRGKLRNILCDPTQNTLNLQYRFRRTDGSYARIIDRGHIIRSEDGEAKEVIGATNDISELIDHKNELTIANKRFSYAMKATKEMIWDWNISNNRIKRSKAFSKIYGYKEKEETTIQSAWLDKVYDKDRERVRESLRTALQDKKIKKWKQEYRFQKSDGERSYVIDRGYIIRDTSGNAIRMVGALLDVTESRALIRKIKKQNKILKEVSWQQAHIVRAPLVRLKGLLQLLEEGSFELWTKEEILHEIRNSADEIDVIITGIIEKTEDIGSSK